MTPSADSDRFERGKAIIEQLNAPNAATAPDTLGDLGQYIVEFIFGDVFTRPGLSLRDRELVTVAMVAALGGREPQLDAHLELAKGAGVTLEEMREVMIQVAPYAGFPAAINGMRRVQEFEASQ